MPLFPAAPPPQTAVDRYGLTLRTAQMLEALHPRRQGNPGNAAAIAPAMVLTGIAAFESFAEELLAVAAAHRGYSLGQIAKLLDINNPTVKTLDDKLNSLLGWTAADRAWTARYTVRVWMPPPLGQPTWIGTQDMNWNDATKASESWMQVRHCLTHGLVRGTRAEHWPGAAGHGFCKRSTPTTSRRKARPFDSRCRILYQDLPGGRKGTHRRCRAQSRNRQSEMGRRPGFQVWILNQSNDSYGR
jgi:hypothetical protein